MDADAVAALIDGIFQCEQLLIEYTAEHEPIAFRLHTNAVDFVESVISSLNSQKKNAHQACTNIQKFFLTAAEMLEAHDVYHMHITLVNVFRLPVMPLTTALMRRLLKDG